MVSLWKEICNLFKSLLETKQFVCRWNVSAVHGESGGGVPNQLSLHFPKHTVQIFLFVSLFSNSFLQILQFCRCTKIELSSRLSLLFFLCFRIRLHCPRFCLKSRPPDRTTGGDLISTRTEIKQLGFSERPPRQPQWKSITRSQPQSVTVCSCYQEQTQGEDGDESRLLHSSSLVRPVTWYICCIFHISLLSFLFIWVEFPH